LCPVVTQQLTKSHGTNKITRDFHFKIVILQEMFLYYIVSNRQGLIIYSFTSRSRIFHLHGDAIITDEVLQNLGICLTQAGETQIYKLCKSHSDSLLISGCEV
jgi:hypothetical protein